MANKKITGRVDIFIDGEKLLNKAGASITGLGISGEPAMQRNTVMGDGGVHGFVEEPIAPTCVIPLTDRNDLLLDSLARKENCTVIFQAQKSGKTYTLEGAWCNNNFTLTAGEGEVEVTFTGIAWTEMAD